MLEGAEAPFFSVKVTTLSDLSYTANLSVEKGHNQVGMSGLVAKSIWHDKC